MTTDHESHPAVRHVREIARAARDEARRRVGAVLDAAGVRPPAGGLPVGLLGEHLRLTINFHPDRVGRAGHTVAEGLLLDGRYRPQAETGLSSGHRSAVPGGARTEWEARLFGGVHGAATEGRPVYGTLDLTRDEHGGSPRFGSSYLVLAPRCLERATFCMGDSHAGPRDVGTADEFLSVAAGLLEDAGTGGGLGRGLTAADILRLLEVGPTASSTARNLDDYVEAQVHGPLSLATDVTALVLDPSFRDSEVHVTLAEAARRHRFELRWHVGSRLAPSDLPEAFRGPRIRALAETIAGPEGRVDAAMIGRSLAHHPFVEPGPDADPETSPLQTHKKLWHGVLAFGAPQASR